MSPRANFAPHRQHEHYAELALEIGGRIRAGREALGWTRRVFARRVGRSNSAVEQWETGLTLPPVEIGITLSRVFGFSLDDLISDAAYIDMSDEPDEAAS